MEPSPLPQQELHHSQAESRKRPRPSEAAMHIGASATLPFEIEWPEKSQPQPQRQKEDGQQHSNFKLNAVVTFTKSKQQQQQQEPNILCLTGRAQLRCLQGAVDILGYRLDPSHEGMMQVESPPWTSLLVFRPVHNVAPGDDDDNNINSVILQVDSWWPQSATETHLEATFELAKSPFPRVRPTCIPPTWEHAVDTILPQLRSIPQKDTSMVAATTTRANSNDDQQSKLLRMAICGAKGVGKSTFLRYALNRILTDTKSRERVSSNPQQQQQQQQRKVAILDADVGQPEMSPPGLLTLTVVSEPLLTPPHYRSMAQFPHDQQISYFFGSITSKNDPHRYMELIRQLVRDYERYFLPLGIPLLVNLDGWVKGLGYELLSILLTEIINPTNVVQIVGLTKSKQFELRGVVNSETSQAELQVIYAYNSSLNNNNNNTITVENESTPTTILPSPANENTGDRTSGEASFLSAMAIKVPVSCTMPAPALRALRLCTYFLNDVSIWYQLGFGYEGIGDDTCEIAHRLAGSLPYAVPFEAVDIEWEGSDHFADIACDSSPRNIDLRLDAINGKLVGLCCRPEKPTLEDDSHSSISIKEEPLRCVGLGLVRSIDRARKIFYILTPVDSELLQNVNVLVGGTVDLPVEFWYRGVHAESFPYQTFGSSGNSAVGAAPMQSRNNIGRKSLGGN